MRRRLILLFLAFVGALVLALATLPFWLGAAARPIARSRGVTFSTYERVGYGRFALKDVEFRRENVRVAVSRVEAPTPLLWGWRHWRSGANPITADQWIVEVTRSTKPPTTTTERGWIPLRAQLFRIAAQLDRWLPQAQTGAGVVRFPGGELALRSATWREQALAVTGLKYREIVADATVAFRPRQDELQLNARRNEDATELAFISRGPRTEGTVTWREQRAALRGNFAPRGWLPAEADVAAEQWSLPADAVKLAPHYARVGGTVKIEWKNERFTANVAATGQPVEGKNVPPLQVDLRGQGDAQAFTIEALRADLPGIVARLSGPVTVERSGKLQGAGARFTVDADLAKQPWFTAAGAVRGEAVVVSRDAGAPAVDFSLTGRDVKAQDLAIAGVTSRGRLTWPRIEVSSATLTGGDGEQLQLRGGWDFRTKEILAASVEGQVRRSTLARWLPAQPAFEAVTISARASGPLAEVQHEGQLRAAQVVVKGVNPLAVSATWKGRAAAVEVNAEASSRESKLTVTTALTREEAKVTALELTQAGEPRLKLDAPATVRWKPALEIQGLNLTGPQGNFRFSAKAGEVGSIEVAAANISAKWFTDFVEEKGPAWQLTLFALMGKWDRGPMTFSLTTGAAVDIGEGRMAAVNAAVRGDQQGVRVEALRATEADATVVNATGVLPITLYPGTDRMLRIDEQAAVNWQASVAPNAAFWQKLAAISGVELVEPEAIANVRGTWAQPEGTVTFKAARLAFDAKKFPRPIPAIEKINVEVAADHDGVTLQRFTLEVEGQPVRAEGRLPVAETEWKQLLKEPLTIAQRGGNLDLDVPEAELAVFARYLPSVLAPKGRVAAHVVFKNGELAGVVRLRNAASRPLGPLGVLQEIEANIELKGRTVMLRGLTARSGGQPVTLSGTIELPEKPAGATNPVQPRFDVTLKGENLPFVRQTGLLLRGDLDLKLQTPPSGSPRLHGTVRLRDSLFLSDVRSFLPQGGAGPTRRPPYFAVETPPLNTWVLAVEVAGERFMRLRTPVFAGVASARFRLSGTLGEPRMIGEVEIDEGAVRMPFARFDVQQAAVRLTESDPYEPMIYLRGTGRRYGYDLAVEIEGKASAPNVVFTSSPALESEQVLLMVMTGAAPRNETTTTATQRITGLGMFLGSSIFGSLSGGAGDPDRLSISSGEKISREGEETYEIEYRLSDRWAITAETNEFDDKILGAKWRWLRGEPKPADAGRKPQKNEQPKK